VLITITRSQSGLDETLGTLQADGLIDLRTIERPWLDNEPDISCVPEGDYDLIPYLSPTHGLVYRLHNPALRVYGEGLVPEGMRFGVEIHPFNFASESEGCIAPGLATAQRLSADGTVQWCVINSLDAMGRIRSLLGTSAGHTLRITSTDAQPGAAP
jgi:hypothetical protein